MYLVLAREGGSGRDRGYAQPEAHSKGVACSHLCPQPLKKTNHGSRVLPCYLCSGPRTRITERGLQTSWRNDFLILESAPELSMAHYCLSYADGQWEAL